MAMGIKTGIYIKLATIMLGAVMPALKEAAKKTSTPADDVAIEALEAALDLLKSGALDELFSK